MRDLYTADNMGEDLYHIADGTLSFEPSFVEVRLRPGGTAEGRVTLSCAPGAGLTAYVTSSSLLMRVKAEAIVGSPADLQWQVDAAYLEAGTEEEGFFRVLCNHGEYKIPFHIAVVGLGEKDRQRETSDPAPALTAGQSAEAQAEGETETAAEAAEGAEETVEAEEAEEAAAEAEAGARPAGSRLMELAARDWQGALRVYYSKSYEYSIRDEGERLLYRGLSGTPGNEQCLEEYLISTCGKSPVTYRVEAAEIRNELIGTLPGRHGSRANPITKYMFPIHCEGWGYVGLKVELSGSFLLPGEEYPQTKVVTLTAGDFIGGSCRFIYRIDRRKLHAGRNFGKIILRSPYQELEISVEVVDRTRGGAEREAARRRDREVKRTLITMMQVYERFRTGKIREDAWLRQEGELLRRLQSQEGRESVIAHLYAAQLYLMEGESRRAIMELETARRRLAGVAPGEVLEMGYTQYRTETDAAYCYRQYLTALAYDDSAMITPRVVYILHDRHRKNPSDWRIAMLMMQLSGEYPAESEARWAFLKKLYRGGSRSPFLYLEAWEMLRRVPGRILSPEDIRSGSAYGNAFEQSVLLYAMKHDLMTREIMQCCIQMADAAAGFKKRLFTILTGAYEMEAMRTLQQPILGSICSMICKSGIVDPSLWPWLYRGVEKGISVMGMEDLYVNSLPEDSEVMLPDSVLRGADPGRLRTVEARTYYYKELYRLRNRFPAEYERAKKDIRNFIGRQIEAHHMSENLAELYSASLQDRDLAPDNVGDLTKLSYIHVLRTTDMHIVRASVLYSQETKERSYPVSGGNCMLPVYGKTNRIFLEDRYKNRFAVSVPYTCDPVMKPVHDESAVSAKEIADLPFAIEVSGVGKGSAEITEQNLPYYEALLLSKELQPEFRAQIGIRILRFYRTSGVSAADGAVHVDRDRIDPVLRNIDFSLLTTKEKGEMIRLVGDMGRSLLAVDLMRRCGPRGMDAGTLARIAVRADKSLSAHEKAVGLVQGSYEAYKEAIGSIAYEAFCLGNRAPALLYVLTRRFEGFTYELEAVLSEISGEENMESVRSDLELRIAGQMLFTGAFVSDWEAMISGMYRRGIRHEETADKLLAQYCHYVFAGELTLGEYVKKRLEDSFSDRTFPEPICPLAYLRTMAAREAELTDFEKETSGKMMEILAGENIIFPFYRDLEEVTGVVVLPRETLLEYRDEIGTGRREGHIVVHYAVGPEGGKESFAAKEMRQVYTGFYVSSFYLFSGEELQYYITDDARETHIVESGTLSRDERMPESGNDRYHMLDRLCRARREGDRDGVLKLLGEFNRADMLVQALFTGEENA